MALLRVSTGRVYTTLEDITPRIGTTRIGAFNYPEAFRRDVARLPVPLSEDGVEMITRNLDPAAVALATGEGLTFRRVGCIIPPQGVDAQFVFAFGKNAKDSLPQRMSDEDMKAYVTPHRVLVNDWHFVMRGGIIKGLQLDNGQQAVLYVQPGEWIRLNANVVNWPIFPHGEPTIGISYFDKEFGSFGMAGHPEVNIRPDMLY